MRDAFKSVFENDYQGYPLFLDKVIRPIFGNELEVLAVPNDITENNDREALKKANIKKIYRVAQIDSDSDVDIVEIFDVTLEDNANISRSRVGIQRFIRSSLFQFTHAFMIFHYENPVDRSWRFSYAYKHGTLTDTTEAKRYTYLFGKNRHCRTAIDRFSTLAGSKKDNKALLDAFSVEALSDEFFDTYRKQYAKFVRYITGKEYVKESGKWIEKLTGTPNEKIFSAFGNNEKTVRDYIKKLMGRITFMHFLQRKGWMCGDYNYMLNLFKKSDKKDDYLDVVLEPLFFGILNTKPENREKLFVEQKWDTSLLKEWKVVPYLNGGLFEADEEDGLSISFPENYFSELFEFYSEYNFTVDENDPDDAEVGVDPEMLGKIFENLLEDNKDKGAFYTPKEIVRYMCQESLIAYLVEKSGIKDTQIRSFVTNPYEEAEKLDGKDIDTLFDALVAVKICDPAIGSGAFPMGLLNELVRCEEALVLGKEENKDRAHLKREIIKNNIYGVDIEKGAIDIARLRFWLSLVVDEDTPSPLPNLDYKIMQGNSLLESYKGVDLSRLTEQNGELDIFSSSEVVEGIQKSLKKKLTSYYDCTNHAQKQQLQNEIKSLIQSQISIAYPQLDLSSIDVAGNQDFFLWHTWFSDVFNRPSDCNGQSGFDIVIGNPPYISAPGQMKNATLAEQRKTLATCGKYSSLYQKWDLFIPFMELGIRYLNGEKGIFSMIVPYPLTNQLYGQELRKQLVNEFSLFELVDLNGTKIFENATVSNCIVFAKRDTPKGSTWISHISETLSISKTFEQPYDVLEQDQEKRVWNLNREKHETMRHSDMYVLGDYCYISKGMCLFSEDGDFNKADLLSDMKDTIHCKEYVEGKNIGKYIVRKIRYVEYNTYRSPALLSRPTFPELYSTPKIIFNILGQMAGTYDDTGLMHNNSLNACVLWKDLHTVDNKSIQSSIKRYSRYSREELEKISETVNIKYLLGVMNSKYADTLLINMRGGDYHIYPEHVRNIPIPAATESQQLAIIKLVDEILSIKKTAPSADTQKQEAEIDALVYELYGVPAGK